MDKKLKIKYDGKRFRNINIYGIYGTEWETGSNVIYIVNTQSKY